MAADYDASEFVDDDFRAAQKPPPPSAAPRANVLSAGDPVPAPSRQEVESQVGEMQHKLAELKRAQQELERERATLEETRRRQLEFTTGREEMVQHLTRGVGLLEEAEFAARRDAEQIAKGVLGLREALVKIQSIQEETWTKDSLGVELARANTVIENARMEWNAARLKFPQLDAPAPASAPAALEDPLQDLVRQRNYAELCKMGLALTWPVALAILAVLVLLALR